jgi:LPXTG-motif cell wall-anchored protein
MRALNKDIEPDSDTGSSATPWLIVLLILALILGIVGVFFAK